MEESAASRERERKKSAAASLRLEEIPTDSLTSPSFTREKEEQSAAPCERERRSEELPADSLISPSFTHEKEEESAAACERERRSEIPAVSIISPSFTREKEEEESAAPCKKERRSEELPADSLISPSFTREKEEESAAACERERRSEIPAVSIISPSFTREKEEEESAAPCKKERRSEELPPDSLISPSFTFEKKVKGEQSAEDIWIVDKRFLKIGKKLETDLFEGKYKDIDVSVKYLKYLDLDSYKFKTFLKLRELSHEHVIEVIGICTDPMNQFVIYEPVCGTIHDALHKERMVFDTPRILKVALAVASGMEFLHYNFICLSPSPSDVFMTNDGVIKLSGYPLLGPSRSINWEMMCDNVNDYGMFLWEIITKECPLKYAREHAQKPLDEEPNGTVEKRCLQPQLSTRDSIMKRVLFDPLIKGIPKETDQKLAEIVERCLSAQPPTFKEITWFLKPVASKTNQKPPGSYHYRFALSLPYSNQRKWGYHRKSHRRCCHDKVQDHTYSLKSISPSLLGKTSHKDVKDSTSWLFRLYYGNRMFMGYCCVSCEVLYIILLLIAKNQTENLMKVVAESLMQCSPLSLLLALSVFGWSIKQIINVIQMKTAADVCVLYDIEKQHKA